MARPIVLGNSEMHVGINSYGQVHDFYYPYVGHENHTIGPETRHKIGIWVDGEITWTESHEWSYSFRYPEAALIGRTTAKNQRLGITLEFDDAVDSQASLFMRNVHVINHLDKSRNIRLFMHQAFNIGDSSSHTDTAQYLPDSQAVIHYRGRRAFVVSGMVGDQSFDQHAIGIFGIEGLEGTWRDADDGELSCNGVEHGRVDSVLRFSIELAPYSSVRAHYWIAAGRSHREALILHRQVQETGLNNHFMTTAKWWKNWLKPTLAVASQIEDAKQRNLLITSTMIVKSHTDKRGAVMASLDSAMLNYGRDAYAYMWPRDGGYIIWPLIRLGYKDEALAFFEFCRRGMHSNGYLAHKYRADGALGSSWHSYQQPDGSIAPPIQEDETALVVFMLAQYYHMHPDAEFLAKYYDSMILPMTNFMTEYVDHATQLPLPSYDLWEERWQVTAYTTALVYAALLSAADLADICRDDTSAVKWRAAAEDMHSSAQHHFYDKQSGHIVRGLVKNDDTYSVDPAIDMSSIFGSFMYGIFATDSPAIKSSFDKAKSIFDQAKHIGLPRYEDDSYHRLNEESASNIWFITTLWYAQYCIEINEWTTANAILEWVSSHSLDSGVLSEQIVTGSATIASVAPLAWSHAEYITTVLDKLSKGDSRI